MFPSIEVALQVNRYRPLCILLLMSLLAACQAAGTGGARPSATVTLDEEPAWLKVASRDDADRIERLAAAWTEALADARKGGFSRQIREEGALLSPDSGLARAAPPPGSYRCRVIKLGTIGRGGRPYVSHKPFFCFVGVAENQLSITKQTGSQRPGGYLWDTDDRAG